MQSSGSPVDERAGMFLNRKLEEKVDKGDILADNILVLMRISLKEATRRVEK